MNRALLGDDSTHYSADNAPTLTYATLMRTVDKFIPKRITIGGEAFNVYEYNVHEDATLNITVLARKRYEEFYLSPDAPLGSGVIIIGHTAGKLMGRKEDIEHFVAHCEPVEPRKDNSVGESSV